jgi:hypothetical protein
MSTEEMNAFESEMRKLVYWLSEDVNPAPEVEQTTTAQLVQCLMNHTNAKHFTSIMENMGLVEEAQDVKIFFDHDYTGQHEHDLDIISFRKIFNWIIGESSIRPTVNLQTKKFLVARIKFQEDKHLNARIAAASSHNEGIVRGVVHLNQEFYYQLYVAHPEFFEWCKATRHTRP